MASPVAPPRLQQIPGAGRHILLATAANLGISRNALEHRVWVTVPPQGRVVLDRAALCGVSPRDGWWWQYAGEGRRCPKCERLEPPA